MQTGRRCGHTARPRPQTVKEATVATKRIQETTRATRGIALFRERRDEIERVSPWTYRVPSCSDRATYTAILSPFTYCSCPDHRRAKDLGDVCKHVYAAILAHAKRRA